MVTASAGRPNQRLVSSLRAAAPYRRSMFRIDASRRESAVGIFAKSIAGVSVLVLLLLWLHAHPNRANPFGQPAPEPERQIIWRGW
jgi:hypothetical protein